MTLDQIRTWCEEHVLLRSREIYNDERGHKREFENGDTYEYRTWHDDGLFTQTAQISINGEIVNTQKYRWENFGWQPITQ